MSKFNNASSLSEDHKKNAPSTEATGAGRNLKSHSGAAVSEDTREFKYLDRIVRKGVKAVFEMGKALTKIKEGNLWQTQYPSWEKYCESVVGHSRSYVHRIIKVTPIAGVVEEITLPNGNKISPLSEAQLRPMVRIKNDPERIREVWRNAVEIADGQPTAEQVEAAVIEILAPKTPKEREQSRGEKRKYLVGELEVALGNAPPEVRKLLSELKELL